MASWVGSFLVGGKPGWNRSCVNSLQEEDLTTWEPPDLLNLFP